MPKLAENRKSNRYYNYYNQVSESSDARRFEYGRMNTAEPSFKPYIIQKKQVTRRTYVDGKKIKRNKFIHKIISAFFVLLFGLTILPFGFNTVTKSFWRNSKYPNVKVDYKYLLNPAISYLSNDWYLDRPLIDKVNTKKPLMQPLKEGRHLDELENNLKYLASSYPSIHAGIYVYNIDSGDYAAVNSEESFATASIIKLPVLVQLFKSIEQGQLNLSEKMSLAEHYRTEGSGDLQFKAANSAYTIDELARRMITDSDNSATNMIVARLGSMTDINSGLRQWGLANTYIQTWLPDLSGTNRTTAKDMATILYNLENKDFLTDTSREKIFDYMGHVKNTRLLKAGLPEEATLLHKTGDIGKMLGDAGIVYTPDNKRYVVVVLANRPHNSPAGKDFIVNASSTIYNYIVQNN